MPISKPLFALLTIVLALSVLAPLIPVQDSGTPSPGDDGLAPPARAAATSVPLMDWHRAAYPWHAPAPTAPPRSPAALTDSPPSPATPTAPPPTAGNPPRPVAPQPPFRYLGRLVRDGKTWIFLNAGENAIAASPGQVIEETWRLDAVRADRLELTYLPLKSAQTLPLDN